MHKKNTQILHKFEIMKVIGITGGIGSGKSFVCKILEEMGALSNEVAI
mgnify:CR=1 FL=1